jgi:hypothetical protein
MLKTFAVLLVLAGHCFMSHTAAAAQSQDCKLCRDDYALDRSLKHVYVAVRRARGDRDYVATITQLV